MESFAAKVQIGLLEGKSNWETWRYKVSIMLRGTPGAMDVIEGTMTKPVLQGAGDAVIAAHELKLEKYIKADSSALLILTSTMSDETLKKVMRFNSAREVWQELHRLFDGSSEDKSYNLCMKFFGAKRDPADDIATHMSKLKNIWNDLNQEITADDNTALPELLLVCKILDTLSEEYFAFRSSWLLMSKTERTVENLTSHLCAFERALSSKQEVLNEEALCASTSNKSKKLKDRLLKCNYCFEVGHRVRNCPKWIRDGKPPKSNSSKSETTEGASMILLSLDTHNTQVFGIEHDKDSWFADNGATSHITNRYDLFTSFERFDKSHLVTIADGKTICAKGKGDIIVQSKKNLITLRDVWYVPEIKRNLFSVLAAHDSNPNTVFKSKKDVCEMSINGDVCLTGSRSHGDGLYKLDVQNVLPSKPVKVYMALGTKQVYNEGLAYHKERHVKSVIKRENNLSLDKDTREGCVDGKAHRLKFVSAETRANKPGEVIHSEVCGPFKQSYSKFQYCVVFKDDYSNYRMVYFMKSREEVKNKLEVMIQSAQAQGNIVKTMVIENGGDFENTYVTNILKKHGIRKKKVTPYTQEQKGYGKLIETARSLINAQEPLPVELWAELTNTSTDVLNRTGTSRVEGKSPYEVWFGEKPNKKHLRVIGSRCFVHVPKQMRKKMDKKAIKGFLIGYDEEGYCVWITDGKKSRLVRSRDVIFEESSLMSDTVAVVNATTLRDIAEELTGKNHINPSKQIESPKDHENLIGPEGDNVVESNVFVPLVERNTESIELEGEKEDKDEYYNCIDEIQYE